jgi:hypothetical protein
MMEELSAIVNITTAAYTKIGENKHRPEFVDGDSFVIKLKGKTPQECTKEIKDLFKELRKTWEAIQTYQE